MNGENNDFKIVVFGEGAVGKSCVVIRLVHNNFIQTYDPTLEDTFQKPLTVDGKQVMLDIIDTAGQIEFQCMRDGYYREGDGFLLVYSITQESSFRSIKSIYEEIRRAREGEEHVPIVLIGNKDDLADKRQVPNDAGRQLARNWACPFFETSARVPHNIEESFAALVREIRKGKEPTSGCCEL